MNEEFTTTEILWASLVRYVTYNAVEIAFLAAYLWSVYFYPQGTVFVLWFGLASSALWTLTMSTDDAYDYARELVMKQKSMYAADFLSGAAVLAVLAVIVRHEPWQFPAMFVVAALQHLRYTNIVLNWKKDEQDRDTNDSL